MTEQLSKDISLLSNACLEMTDQQSLALVLQKVCFFSMSQNFPYHVASWRL